MIQGAVTDFVKEAKTIREKIDEQDLTNNAQQALTLHAQVSDLLSRADEAGLINLDRLELNNSWVGKDVEIGIGTHPYKTRTVIRSKDSGIHLSDPALHFKLAVGHVQKNAMAIYNMQNKPNIVQASPTF